MPDLNRGLRTPSYYGDLGQGCQASEPSSSEASPRVRLQPRSTQPRRVAVALRRKRRPARQPVTRAVLELVAQRFTRHRRAESAERRRSVDGSSGLCYRTRRWFAAGGYSAGLVLWATEDVSETLGTRPIVTG